MKKLYLSLRITKVILPYLNNFCISFPFSFLTVSCRSSGGQDQDLMSLLSKLLYCSLDLAAGFHLMLGIQANRVFITLA